MGEIKQCVRVAMEQVYMEITIAELLYKNAQSDKRHACEQLPDTYRLDGVLCSCDFEFTTR